LQVKVNRNTYKTLKLAKAEVGFLTIRLKIHGRLKDFVGKDEIVINKDEATLSEVINALIRELGEKAKSLGLESAEDILKPRTKVVMMVNGFSVKVIGDLNYRLKVGDEANAEFIDVDVLAIVDGG